MFRILLNGVCGTLIFDLQKTFFLLLAALLALLALLCFLKRFTRRRIFSVLGDILRYLCLQGLTVLAFLAVYVLYVKNGRTPRLSDIGVAMLPFTVFVFWFAWRFSLLGARRTSLLYPLCYSAFLLWRFFSVGGGLKFFGYVLLNPVYGFIGSDLLESKLRPLAAVSALLPFACAAVGYGLALKGIDKKRKV